MFDKVFDHAFYAIAFRQAGGTLPADFTWRAKDNTNITFTDADIDALILLIGTNKLAAAANLHAKKDEVKSASSKSAVNAVAW